MARLGRLERPTSGSGEHGIFLMRYENFRLCYILLAVTTTRAWTVCTRSAQIWTWNYHVFITPVWRVSPFRRSRRFTCPL